MKVSRLVTNSAMVVRWASRVRLRRESAVKEGWAEEVVSCESPVGFDIVAETGRWCGWWKEGRRERRVLKR